MSLGEEDAAIMLRAPMCYKVSQEDARRGRKSCARIEQAVSFCDRHHVIHTRIDEVILEGTDAANVESGGGKQLSTPVAAKTSRDEMTSRPFVTSQP